MGRDTRAVVILALLIPLGGCSEDAGDRLTKHSSSTEGESVGSESRSSGGEPSATFTEESCATTVSGKPAVTQCGPGSLTLSYVDAGDRGTLTFDKVNCWMNSRGKFLQVNAGTVFAPEAGLVTEEELAQLQWANVWVGDVRGNSPIDGTVGTVMYWDLGATANAGRDAVAMELSDDFRHGRVTATLPEGSISATYECG